MECGGVISEDAAVLAARDVKQGGGGEIKSIQVEAVERPLYLELL